MVSSKALLKVLVLSPNLICEQVEVKSRECHLLDNRIVAEHYETFKGVAITINRKEKIWAEGSCIWRTVSGRDGG